MYTISLTKNEKWSALIHVNGRRTITAQKFAANTTVKCDNNKANIRTISVHYDVLVRYPAYQKAFFRIQQNIQLKSAARKRLKGDGQAADCALGAQIVHTIRAVHTTSVGGSNGKSRNAPNGIEK